MDLDESIVKFIIILIVALAGVGLASLAGGVWNDYEQGRNQLAHQIAEGTHEVVWSTNEFGTMEVRIVEVKGTTND